MKPTNRIRATLGAPASPPAVLRFFARNQPRRRGRRRSQGDGDAPKWTATPSGVKSEERSDAAILATKEIAASLRSSLLTM
ncbi:hypothetical protein AGMMS49545_05640 [Betaproteobacteria bacterium]|nr:hypothetical protein AGMMS49545_05640 [Betaproteobacteria bacterium]GHU42860.1 hypothetical protein AGMMS50289_08280 [Betaproteobacteria bacterium]